MATINVDALAAEINRTLRLYANGVGEKAEELAEQLAKEGATRLKVTSPKRSKNGGSYARSWKAKKIGDQWTIYNEKHYQLTHLLENGHANRNGGRTRSFTHIEPVEQDLINKFAQGVERAARE